LTVCTSLGIVSRMKSAEACRESTDDRRICQRIQLDLATAFPVRLETEVGPMRGMARNVSQGGMLVEARELPPIGTRVTVIFEIPGKDPTHRMELEGDVRHHVKWSVGRPDRGSFSGFGVRFRAERTTSEDVPPGTLH
jgi:hypothetical protein